MKNIISLLFGILLFQSALLNGQTNTDSVAKTNATATDELKLVLQDTYADFDSAKSVMDMQTASNRFGLIAKKWATEWVAQYYASYTLVILSYIEKDEKKRDAYLDEADKLYDKASVLIKSENDEIYVLGALIANGRLAVSPMNRYQKYGAIFNQNLEKAKAVQPNNPRIYYLQGTSFYYTPKAFGGGAKNAIALFEKADALFQNEKSNDILKPNWGKKQNSDLLKKCQEELK
jgi:hypothetical protein